MRKRADVGAGVAALHELSREDLVERWRKIYGVMPPKGVRRELMIRAAAWHLQAKRLGGPSAETRRLLRSAISRVESELLARDKTMKPATAPDFNGAIDDPTTMDGEGTPIITSPQRTRRRLTPGARLMREWGGRTHVVDVIEGGYVFEAKVYASLTAIAGQITGVHWSGPRFFGL
jgi:hypothetical protein